MCVCARACKRAHMSACVYGIGRCVGVYGCNGVFDMGNE